MKESNDVPVLTRTEEGLALVSGEQVLMGDFTRLLPRLKRLQTELLVNEANGNKTPVDVLLVHAQDHLMTSMLAVELIKELIEIYKNKN